MGGGGTFGLDTIIKKGYFWKMGKISPGDPPTSDFFYPGTFGK